MFDDAMMILASGIDKKYYENLGYTAQGDTHLKDPLMVKYISK